MTPTAYCVIAVSALVLFLLRCLVVQRRERDRDTDRTGPETGQSVDYWEAEVDRWLAQLAEIRNLVTLTEGDDHLRITPPRTSVASTEVDGMGSTPEVDSTIGCGAASEPSAATKLPA
jgi:hypothetical protein